jgi:hypothetical protein
MKHIQTLVFAAIWGFVLTLAAGACAQSIHPGVATVVRIVGEARYSLGDGVWHPLVAGKILAAGAVIQTGHDATVDIILGKKILDASGGSTAGPNLSGSGFRRARLWFLTNLQRNKTRFA